MVIIHLIMIMSLAKELPQQCLLVKCQICSNRSKIALIVDQFIFKGKAKNGADVAVKLFNDDEDSLSAFTREYNIYKKLGAMDGSSKKYGIPHILFAGDFKDTKVIVMPKYYKTLMGMMHMIFQNPVEIWLNALRKMVCYIIYYE